MKVGEDPKNQNIGMEDGKNIKTKFIWSSLWRMRSCLGRNRCAEAQRFSKNCQNCWNTNDQLTSAGATTKKWRGCLDMKLSNRFWPICDQNTGGKICSSKWRWRETSSRRTKKKKLGSMTETRTNSRKELESRHGTPRKAWCWQYKYKMISSKFGDEVHLYQSYSHN